MNTRRPPSHREIVALDAPPRGRASGRKMLVVGGGGLLRGEFHMSRSSARWDALGLALVRACAEAHRGQVEVQSNQQDGTTFTHLHPRASS